MFLAYCNRKYTLIVWKYELITLKFVLVNEKESNRKVPKRFTSKNLQMKQKSLTRWFNQNMAWRGLLKIDAYMAAWHQIILSWLNETFF